MLGKPRILSLFPSSFNKFNKHEHSCKILYIFLVEVIRFVVSVGFERYQTDVEFLYRYQNLKNNSIDKILWP